MTCSQQVEAEAGPAKWVPDAAWRIEQCTAGRRHRNRHGGAVCRSGFSRDNVTRRGSTITAKAAPTHGRNASALVIPGRATATASIGNPQPSPDFLQITHNVRYVKYAMRVMTPTWL